MSDDELSIGRSNRDVSCIATPRRDTGRMLREADETRLTALFCERLYNFNHPVERRVFFAFHPCKEKVDRIFDIF